MTSQILSSQGAVNVPLNPPYTIDIASFIGCGQTKRSYSCLEVISGDPIKEREFITLA